MVPIQYRGYTAERFLPMFLSQSDKYPRALKVITAALKTGLNMAFQTKPTSQLDGIGSYQSTLNISSWFSATFRRYTSRVDSI